MTKPDGFGPDGFDPGYLARPKGFAQSDTPRAAADTYWSLARPAKRYLALVDLAAIAAVALGLSTSMPDLQIAVRFVVIAAIGFVYTELAGRLDRFKRY